MDEEGRYSVWHPWKSLVASPFLGVQEGWGADVGNVNGFGQVLADFCKGPDGVSGPAVCLVAARLCCSNT